MKEREINRQHTGAHYNQPQQPLAHYLIIESESVSCLLPSDSLWPQGLSMGFYRQEYWRGLPFPSLGDLPNPGIEPRSPALQADSLPLSHQGSPAWRLTLFQNLSLHKMSTRKGTRIAGPCKLFHSSDCKSTIKKGNGRYTYGWFALLYGRNQHNIVKQFSSN